MTFTANDALLSARRAQERQRRLMLMKARQVRIENSLSSAQLMSARIRAAE